KVAPPSLAENLKVAEEVLDRALGVEVRLTTGATVSTVQLQVAVPTLPARSVAEMVSVCWAWARPVMVQGEVQATAVPESSWQVNVLCSEAENPNVAVVELAYRAGPEEMVSTGLVASTVQAQGTAVDWLLAM